MRILPLAMKVPMVYGTHECLIKVSSTHISKLSRLQAAVHVLFDPGVTTTNTVLMSWMLAA